MIKDIEKLLEEVEAAKSLPQPNTPNVLVINKRDDRYVVNLVRSKPSTQILHIDGKAYRKNAIRGIKELHCTLDCLTVEDSDIDKELNLASYEFKK